MIRLPMSFGETADRISILQIKRERIRDPRKLANIEAELAQAMQLLLEHVPQTTEFKRLFAQLKGLNGCLWQIEEELREHERKGEFGPEFVALARSVYRNNDERFRVKREIDQFLGSPVREEKSYSDVECSQAPAQSPAPAQD
jgi:hypothetical protein